MCGIAGFVGLDKSLDDQALATIAAGMSDALAHRGPDGHGVWTDAQAGVALGHRRLAVIDLTSEGAQPMVSHSGRYVLVFNGEIYNFRALRRELERAGIRFRGHSDTEVLLSSIERWGLRGALDRSNGMFAFALWDRDERTLHLVRDRLGEKPLYYGMIGRSFLFGSELKALQRSPTFDARINRQAIALLLRLKYVPAPYSIYEGIAKLPPATILTLRERHGFKAEGPLPYWSARDAVERGAATPFAGSLHEAADELDSMLRDAVRIRMESDVPLGAFLSGGIDSTTVTAMMQSESSRPVKTFTVALADAGFDESSFARAIATRIGSDHTELSVTPTDALDAVDLLPSLYDEPFSDSSQIPTYLISRCARRYVTVALSGDGGDELFGGYNRHAWVERLARSARWVPRPARRVSAAAIRRMSPASWDRAFHAARGVLPRRFQQRVPGDKMHKLADALGSGDARDMYVSVTSHWHRPADVVLGTTEPSTLATDSHAWPALATFGQEVMFVDAVTYLPDDILAKVDRASMGVSLETRVPMLDHRIFEFAATLPVRYTVGDGRGKVLLREVVQRYVPAELIERPKSGFGIPIGEWLRGPLREWTESLLNPRRLIDDGFFDPVPIRQAWDDHVSRRANRGYQLWDVLMFNAWLDAGRRAHSSPIQASL